jgi:hypothetical protein
MHVHRIVAQTRSVVSFLLCTGFVAGIPSAARAGDAFHDYRPAEPFRLPTGATEFDVLADGRLITTAGAEVLTEQAVGTRAFERLGTLPDADFSDFGPTLLRVSPDGRRMAIGNGGGASFRNFQVGVFDLRDLSGDWFGVAHFDGAWYDDENLALTAGVFGAAAYVTLLDTMSHPGRPLNPRVIDNIGGASGGVVFAEKGQLITGNGFADRGPSTTGTLKSFTEEAWMAAVHGGDPADFEGEGTFLGDILSAGSLGFDAEGNLHVAGGDFDENDVNYAALIRASIVRGAIHGQGPIDRDDPEQVRRLDPDDENPFNFYDVVFNPVTGELYVREGAMVYPYVVPEPSTAMLLAFAGVIVLRRPRGTVRRTPRGEHTPPVRPGPRRMREV